MRVPALLPQVRGAGWSRGDASGPARRLARLLPFTRWSDRVDAESLRVDALAGLTGAIVMLPQGVAFATIAGMPPQYGLYAGMVPAIVAALFGSSWHLVSGPTTAASIVLFSSLSVFAEPGSAHYVQLALTLTVMVGLIQLAMGVARLGTLVNFISHSVVLGFTAGAAILIAANQLKHFFGIEIPRGAEFYETIHQFLARTGEINPYVAAVGAGTVASGILIKRFAPRFPYMIGAMLAGSLLATALDRLFGAAHAAIPTVGALPASLPPLSAPDVSLATVRELAPAALAVTLFALTEAVSISRSLALRAGQQLDGNQEFIGQGLSNIAGGFFSGFVATGSFNRSALNYEAGARTPLAAVFSGVLLMVVVILVAPYAAYLPNAAMAGILILVAWSLIDFHHIRKAARTSWAEAAILGTTFLSTLFLELAFAIFLGVILSLVLYLNRTSRPRLLPLVPDPRLPKRQLNTDPALSPCPQMGIVRVDGSLFFGAIASVGEQLRAVRQQQPQQRHVAILASGVNFIDVAGAEFLAHEASRLSKEGGGLYLIRAKPGVVEPLRRGGYLDEIGEDRLFGSKSEAIASIFDRLDSSVCAACSHRVFNECAGVPAPAMHPKS
jgi:SulP family sulfate permease